MKTIKTEATKVCTSIMYASKKMKTVAVACDGVVECQDEEDEGWLCTNSSIPMYGTLGVFALLLLVLIIYKICKGSFKEIVEEAELLVLPNVLDPEVFKRDHDKETFRDDLNLFIQRGKVFDSKAQE